MQGPECLLDEAEDDDARQGEDEEVGGDREVAPGLSNAAQIAVEEQEHHRHRDLDREPGQAGHGTGERRRAGRRLHGDGHRVVDQQRDGGDLRDARPEVVAGDHVGAAGLGIELDDLQIGEGHEEEDAEDGQRDGDDQHEGGQAYVGHQLGQHLLGAVRRGRDAVGREHPERDDLVEALARQLLGDQWRPEQLVLQPVPAGLGNGIRRHPGQRRGAWPGWGSP